MQERRFKPSEAHRLEDPERLTWLPPAEILAGLTLNAGMDVADIGAGTGYFTLPIARVIAPLGQVFAVDVEPEMLQKLQQKLVSQHAPQNIVLVEGDATRTSLHDRSVDLVLMANLWHELDDYFGALREAGRILRSGGRMAILDWRPDVDRPPGPPLEHRVPLGQVSEFLNSNSWSVKTASNIGRYSYLVTAVVLGK